MKREDGPLAILEAIARFIEGRKRWSLTTLLLILGLAMLAYPRVILTILAANSGNNEVVELSQLEAWVFYVAGFALVICGLVSIPLNLRYAAAQRRDTELRNKVADLSLKLAKEEILRAPPRHQVMADFLNATVRHCVQQHEDSPEEITQKYPDYFWAKIYRWQNKGSRLYPEYRSVNVPEWEHEHWLVKGQGGAGQLALHVVLNIDGSSTNCSPQFHAKVDLLHGLTDQQKTTVSNGTIQSQLSAPVFWQELVEENGRKVFREKLPETHGARFLLGVLCFCSNKEPSRTTLGTDIKRGQIMQTARMSGYLLAQLIQQEGGRQEEFQVAPLELKPTSPPATREASPTNQEVETRE